MINDCKKLLRMSAGGRIIPTGVDIYDYKWRKGFFFVGIFFKDFFF